MTRRDKTKPSFPTLHDADADLVSGILRGLGYSVERIPESREPKRRRCDLAATRAEERLLIEVKRWEQPPSVRTRLESGEPVRLGGPVGWRSKDHEKLRDAVDQLLATAESRPGFEHVVWARLAGPGDIHQNLTLFSTLYGVRFVHVMGGPGVRSGMAAPCFCAEPTSFSRMRSVAGVVVESHGRIGMRLSPSVTSEHPLARTSLVQRLRAHNAVFHLPELRTVWALSVPDGTCADVRDAVDHLWRTGKIRVRPVPPSDAVAEFVAWPGNELGHYPGVPGSEFFAPLWELLAQPTPPAAVR